MLALDVRQRLFDRRHLDAYRPNLKALQDLGRSGSRTPRPHWTMMARRAMAGGTLATDRSINAAAACSGGRAT